MPGTMITHPAKQGAACRSVSSRSSVKVFASATSGAESKVVSKAQVSACGSGDKQRGEASVRASRRAVLLSGLAMVGASQPQPARADTDAPAAIGKGVSYDDPIDRFTIAVPDGWVSGEGVIGSSQGGFGGVTGARRTVAWFPADVPARDVNVTVVVSNVSVEFTKLGSFGSVGSFASNLVNSLDRSYVLNAPSWARRSDEPVQVAKLVDYKEAKGQYFVEYTVQKLPEAQRHLLSTLALGSNGRYNRLYTVTAQCTEDQLPKYRAQLEQILDSFKANVKPMA